MTSRVLVAAQVEAFVKALAPDPRQRLRQGIKRLAVGEGDLQWLEAELAGYQRLRVKSFRVIFKERFEAGERVVDCLYANRRSVVYELFEDLIKNELL